MAQTRSITNRNFWGGLLGGVFGILATAKFGALALAAGCLIGVMLGFYYQELWQVAKNSWNGTARRLIGLKLGFPEWAELHPYDKALRIKKEAMWAAASTMVGIVAALLLLFPLETDRSEDISIMWLLAFAVLFLSTLVAVGGRFGEEFNGVSVARRLHYYFKLQQLYVNQGGPYLFAREFILGFAGMLIVPAGLVVLVLVAVLLFIVWPVTATLLGVWFLCLFAFGFMRGTYRLAMRPDHWSCLAITITITGIVAVLAHGHLEGVELWFAALIAGVLSGVGSAKAHPILHRWFEARPRLARFFAHSAREHILMFFEIVRALVSPARYQLKVRAVLAHAVQ